MLTFVTSRGDVDNTFSTYMTPEQQVQLKYDIALEVARMGAFYATTEDPYSVTIWDTLPVDETLSEAKVVERASFIQRVDHLVQQVYGKHTSAAMATILPSLAAASRPLTEEESRSCFSGGSG